MDPYRDEFESLRRENARLRASLHARREPRVGVAVLLAAADLGAILLMRPWLNGGGDMKFWSALIVVLALAIAAAASAFGYKPRHIP